ncbi:MAG: HlyD family secretion protein [Candidatus Binatia bacterium]
MKEAQKRTPNIHELTPAIAEEAVASARRQRPKAGRILLYGILALLVVAAIVFGIQTIVFYTHHVTTDDAQIEGHIAPVLPRVAGYVAEVLVRDNQRIDGNHVLVRIDPRDLQSRVNIAQAALLNAEAAVSVARANLEASRAKREKTSTDFGRNAPLLKQRVISPQEYDATKAAADAAEAEYQAAARQVTAAEAQVAQRQADLEYAHLQLSYTTVAAPAPGFVAKKNVEVGQYIEAGQPLMAIVQDAEVWVVANFKETQLRKMRVGQPVTVEVDAYPERVFHARVDSIASATGAKFALLPPDNATGNFVKVVQRVPVKIVFTDTPDPAHPLRVGMNVTTVVDVG